MTHFRVFRANTTGTYRLLGAMDRPVTRTATGIAIEWTNQHPVHPTPKNGMVLDYLIGRCGASQIEVIERVMLRAEAPVVRWFPVDPADEF